MDDTERPVVTGPGPSVTAEPASQPEEVSETPQADAAPQALSKNAIKKAAKAEKYAAYKLERRAREKETKKEKKRVVAEKRAAGELDEDEEEKKRQKKRPKIHFGGKVIVDLGFDEMMNEKVCDVRFLPQFGRVTCRQYRKSHHCVPSWRTPTVQIAMRHIPSLWCTLHSMAVHLRDWKV